MTLSPRRRWLLAGLAIGVISLAIRIWLFQQPLNSDDVQYFSQAAGATDLSTLADPTQANGLRLPVLVVPALYSQAFSPFTAFYATIYTFASIGFAGVFAFAWVMSGPRVAVFTAAIWATSYVAIADDTRLTPDNVGTGLALIGLALVAWVAFPPRDDEPPRPERRVPVIAAAAAGGLLCYVAFFCRESFFVFGGVAVGIAALSTRRWTLLGAVAGGLLAGFLLEVVVMSVGFDDGLVRFGQTARYGQGAVASGSSGGAYAGYTFGELFVRYPRLVLDAGTPEMLLHVGGLIGFAVWGIRGRDRRNLAKLGCGVAAYGFLAFGVVSVDPVVPVMREKLRYYVTCAPLLYLAVAELIDRGVFATLGGRFARFVDHRARAISIAAIAAGFVIVNLVVASRADEFARNGNDGHWTTSARMRADAQLRHRARVVATDGRTARVAYILLSRGARWERVDLASVDANPVDAYALLDWKRLNGNVRHGYEAASLTHQVYGLIEDHYLVGRSIRANDIIDAFYLGAAQRRVDDVDAEFPAGWSVMCAGRDPVPAAVGAQPCPVGGNVLVFQGTGAPWRSRVAPLQGDRFVEVVIRASTSEMTPIRAYLHWWAPHDTQIQRQLMGAVEVTPGVSEYRLWTYLPQSAEGYRVVLRTRSQVAIDDVDLRLLERLPEDDVRPLGQAWRAEPIHDQRLDLVASAIRTAAGERDVVVSTDAATADAGRTQLPGWRWEVDGTTGFLILDPSRAAVTTSVLDRGAVIARSLEDESIIDIVEAQPVARDRVELALAGWTKIEASTKSITPIEGAATFTDANANEEYIYSGADFPWKSPPAQPIAADRFVEVTGTVVDAGTGGPLRAYLYWWPPGEKKRVTQLLGTVHATKDATAFSVWTYLPREAASFRIGFRAGAGVTVSDVRAFSVGRVDADELAVFGAPW